jgi:hypothetical protein
MHPESVAHVAAAARGTKLGVKIDELAACPY